MTKQKPDRSYYYGVEKGWAGNSNPFGYSKDELKPAVAAAIPAPKVSATAAKTLEIGDQMKDDTIYAGLSPDTGQQMFVTPIDAGAKLTFDEAKHYASVLNRQKAYGHDVWCIPTEKELNVLFENRNKGALKGTFGRASYSVPKYWSSTPDGVNYARVQDFKSGARSYNHLSFSSLLRCIRRQR